MKRRSCGSGQPEQLYDSPANRRFTHGMRFGLRGRTRPWTSSRPSRAGRRPRANGEAQTVALPMRMRQRVLKEQQRPEAAVPGSVSSAAGHSSGRRPAGHPRHGDGSGRIGSPPLSRWSAGEGRAPAAGGGALGDHSAGRPAGGYGGHCADGPGDEGGPDRPVLVRAASRRSHRNGRFDFLRGRAGAAVNDDGPGCRSTFTDTYIFCQHGISPATAFAACSRDTLRS